MGTAAYFMDCKELIWTSMRSFCGQFTGCFSIFGIESYQAFRTLLQQIMLVGGNLWLIFSIVTRGDRYADTIRWHSWDTNHDLMLHVHCMDPKLAENFVCCLWLVVTLCDFFMQSRAGTLMSRLLGRANLCCTCKFVSARVQDNDFNPLQGSTKILLDDGLQLSRRRFDHQGTASLSTAI